MSHPNDYDMIVAQNVTLATVGAEEQFQREVPGIVDALLEMELGKRDEGTIKVNVTITLDKRKEGLVIGSKCSTKIPAYVSKAKVGHISRDNKIRVMTEKVEQSTMSFEERQVESGVGATVDDDPQLN